MAVQALKDYKFPPADSQDKFHGGQLLYVGWDDHLMFCSPFAYCSRPSKRECRIGVPFLGVLDTW